MKTHRITAIIMIALLAVCLSVPALALNIESGIEYRVNKQVYFEADGVSEKATLSAQYFDLLTDIKVNDRITLTPKVGLVYEQINSNKKDLDTVKTEAGYSLGIDADILLAPNDVADLYAIASYRYTNANIDKVAGNVVSGRERLVLHDFEFGPKFQRAINVAGYDLVPYVALVYSDTIGTLKTKGLSPNTKKDVDAKDNLGLRFGTSAKLADNLTANVGMKLFDETAASASLSYRF
jgi:hypothetical protein